MAGHRVEDEPAFVLHRRPYRETSFIVDLFSYHHGAMSAVARGAGRAGRAWKAELQPFQPIRVGWQGRHELKTLTAAEATAPPIPLRGERLYCGFYMNELLQRLLTDSEAAPALFSAYLDALETLAETEQPLEAPLRRFEWALACELGHGFSWDWVADTGKPVEAAQFYAFDPRQGIMAEGYGKAGGLPGSALLVLANGDMGAPNARRTAKQIMRQLMDHLLQGRPLHSRRLFSGKGGGNHDAGS